MKRNFPALIALGVSAVACGGGGGGSPTTPTSPASSTELLSSTGLYSNAASREVDARNRPYSPQYALWSDGGTKRRWVQLPAGARIDTSDMDRWVFPTGTKFWKEFSFQGRLVETRLIDKVGADASLESWRFKTYAWRQDQSDAELASPDGVANVAPTSVGTAHDIPSVANCRDCHQRGGDPVLGFGALQLSPDRDPLAREPVPAGAVNLDTLAAEGRITLAPASPPSIVAASGTGRAAMGYFHANCGNCHNPRGLAASSGMFLYHTSDVRRERDEPAYATAVNQLTLRYTVPGTVLNANSFRIRGGSPELSAVIARMSARGNRDAMPPIGTEAEDVEAVGLISDWIRGLPR